MSARIRRFRPANRAEHPPVPTADSAAPLQQLFTPREAARTVLHPLSATTVWSWCKSGVLPHVVVNGRIYLRRSDLVREGWVSA